MCWQILSTHLHNVYKVQIFIENKLLRSVLQTFSSARTLAHELLKAPTALTVSLSTVAVFPFFRRLPRMTTYTPNKAKTLQNPHVPCLVSQTPGMLVDKLRLM